MTLEEVFKDISEIEGVEAVEIITNMHVPEWPNPRIITWRKYKKFLNDLGLKIASYSEYMDSEILSNRSLTLQEQVEMIQEYIARASLMEADVMRIEQPPRTREDFMRGGEDARWHGAGPYVLSSDWAIKGLNMIAPTCEEYGVKLCLEIHAPSDPRWHLDLMKQVDTKWIGLCPDFGTWATKPTAYSGWGWGTLADFKECIPYTFHVHAKCFVFDENGDEPAIPFNKLIPALVEGGYKGYISTEFENWYVTDDDCRIGNRKAVALIKKYL
jgi:sugar phosphate isomerase/epimerase